MAHAASQIHSRAREDSLSGRTAIPVMALGLSLSLFFALSFALCVLGYYVLPSLPIAHGALAIPLPGFAFDSGPRFLLGLVESFAWGWYVALIFAPLYNFFVRRYR